MPSRRAPEYETNRRTRPDQISTVRTQAVVAGHNVRYVLSFGLIGAIVGIRDCVPRFLSSTTIGLSACQQAG